ncbi:MAG: ATP-binding protein [Saprospiraceae bacterium]|nr:ATP-binding protein [Saprospiraceae bacterium]
MIERLLSKKILRDLSWSPIVGLIGSRQVGKTTLVKHLQPQIEKPTLYLDLELQEDWFKLEDAQSYLSGHADKCVIIDEIQVRPELFALLRALTDQKREPARFILLGSASPHIVKLNTETLAGRIAYHELPPFSFSEIRNLFSQEEHWLRGGFPGALLASETYISRKWLDDFTETFIHRDLARLGFTVPAGLLRNMLSMMAHLHGGTFNASALAASLGVTSPTANKYLELLEGSFLIRRLPPYFANLGKRLTKSPKLYLRDSGLLHYLLRVFDLENLRGNPAVGASWEGYVIEQIIREAPEFSDFYYYRTQHGAEVDLVMITPKGKKVCIEIKFSISPSISKGFYQSIADLQSDFNYVITPGGERFDRNDGLRICPLSIFLEKELPSFE